MSHEIANKKIVLKSNVLNPFEDWSDWFGTDGEVIITVQTMPFTLWEQWEKHCIRWEHCEECDHSDDPDGIQERINCEKKRRVVTPENFDAETIPDPGIHRTETNYDEDEDVDEIYKIYVSRPYLSLELCRKWIQNLNEQYNRNFRLELTEEQKNARVSGYPSTKTSIGIADDDSDDEDD